MYILSVEVENFGSFEHAKYSVPDRGLILVEGVNRDSADGGSNGAGKSMLIADALSWCLYGKTLRGASHDEVVRAGSTEGTRVSVCLTAFGQGLVITRHRKHSTGKNSCIIVRDGQDITPATKPDELIAKLIRTPWSVWQYALCLGQGLAYRFMALTDAQRVGLIEELLSLSVYDRARAYARTKRAAAVSGLEAAKHTMRLRGDLVAAATSAAEMTRKVLGTLQRDRAASLSAGAGREELLSRVEAAETEVEEARATAACCNSTVVSAQSRARSAEQGVRSARTLIASCAAQMATSTENVATANSGRCFTCKQSLSPAKRENVAEAAEKTRAEFAEAHSRALAELADEEAKLAEARAEVAQASAAASVWLGSLDRAKTKLDALRRELALMPAAVSDDALMQAQASLDSALAQAEQAQADQQAAAVEAERYQRESEQWAYWADGFSRIRQTAMERAVEALSARFQHYLSALFGVDVPASIRLDTKKSSAGEATSVRVDVATPGGSYVTASGGERDRIDLALAFALHDLVTQASGVRANLLVADEVGGFVDEEGVARIVELLSEKADNIGTVFVMTQNPVWRKHIDHVWTVTKEEGKSRVYTHKD